MTAPDEDDVERFKKRLPASEERSRKGERKYQGRKREERRKRREIEIERRNEGNHL